MATSGIYGASAESVGLYGIGSSSGGTYFEWFIFNDSATAPATPTGGSWSFTTNTGTAPSGWLNAPPASPTNLVWVSIAVVDSRTSATLTWSTPGLLNGAGLPVLTGSGAPSSGTGLNTQLYLDTSTTPQSLYNKQSGSWVQVTGSTLYMDLTSAQTIAGTKTFSSEIQGSISGTALNVTGTVAVANGGTGSTTASGARTNLEVPSLTGTGASGTWGIDVTGNAATATSAVSVQGVTGDVVGTTQTQTLTNKTISGSANTLTDIGNSSLVNSTFSMNGQVFTLGAVQLVGADLFLPSYVGNAGRVLTVNPSSSNVEWKTVSGTGTVTSVDVSGGTTGLTTSGGPIDAAGTITIGGTLALASGGTGATTASGARGALGLGTAAQLNAGIAGGVATLDGGGTVPTSQLPAAVLGSVKYQGTWDADVNSPTLASSTGTEGYYYVVSVAGSTNLNGITDWKIGDWAIYNGTAWQKIDNTDSVTSVNGFTGTVVLTNTDISGFGTMSTQNANAVAITGGSITGITDLAVADGGTGASDASGARTNLGLGTISTQNANSVAITGGTLAGVTSMAIGTATVDKPLTVVDSGQCIATFKSTGTSGGGITFMDADTSDSDAVGIGANNDDLCFRSGGVAGVSMTLTSAQVLTGPSGGFSGVVGATGATTGTFTTLTATSDSAFTSTGAVQLSSGTTGQRPTGAAGKLRFNTTTAEFEGYNGAAWASVGGAALSNDTTTATDEYPLFASATSGTASTLYTSNAQYLFKPSTGELKVKAPVAANGLLINADSVTSDYTVATGTNALSVGPITVASGVSVTVASGQRWLVL